MASSTEISLINRLETSDYKNILQSFIDYLQPFSSFISLDGSFGSKSQPKKNVKSKKNLKSDPKLLHPLAKKFFQFISNALKILSNRLSEPPKPSGNEDEEEGKITLEVFSVYRICLDCLGCISPCLDCKPLTVYSRRSQFVRRLEVCGFYGEAEIEGVLLLEDLCSVSLVKGRKIKGQLVPHFNEDPELGCLILEIVSTVVKCAFKSKSSNEANFQRILTLIDQIKPWLRNSSVLNSKEFERWHRDIVTNLYKCTRFMLGEITCFEEDMLQTFCLTTLTECLKSHPKDQSLAFAHSICSSLCSQWDSKPELILDVLQCLLDSILCECKVNVEYSVNAFLDLLPSCVERCQISNADTGSGVTKYLYKKAGGFIQDMFRHLCNVAFPILSYISEAAEKDRLYESRITLLHAAIASFIVSLIRNNNFQQSMDCIDNIASMGLVQSKEMKFLISSIFNVGADLYNTKQYKLASVSLEVCCRALWTRVSLLCKNFIDTSEGTYDNLSKESQDLSEETITGLVTEACVKNVTLLDALHHCGSPNLYKNITDSLSQWALAREKFESLSAPATLIKMWVKIMYKECKEMVDNVPTLYSLLSKSSPAWSKRTLSIILEQELLAYEELEAYNMNLSQKMQLKIMDILLLHIYVTDDYPLQKSRILVKKGKAVRTRENEGLNSCIQCLSEAVSTLINMSCESSHDAQVSHQLAVTYCLRALCFQEAKSKSEVILSDIDNALVQWSSINWSLDGELVTCSPISLLCSVADLLSLKGSSHSQNDVSKLIIIFLKRKNYTLEQCLAMLWEDRRLTHALCTSPVDEEFLSMFEHYFGVTNSIGFWKSCIKDSPELLIGVCQGLSIPNSFFAQIGHYHSGSPLQEVTADRVKEVASDLVSKGRGINSAFLAGYLYYDLSEKFISAGQLFKALSYAREALSLRTKLLKKKFSCTFEKQPSSSESRNTHQQYELIHLQLIESVATEVWPHTIDSWTLEGRTISQWNILQCYLESVLQVGKIHEATGNATVAEAHFLLGRRVSCTQSLPIFRVIFTSALGEIYQKKQLWDLAENELNTAKQLLMDSSTTISCNRCKLSLESIIYQQIGDLTRSRLGDGTRTLSIKSMSLTLDLYRSAIEKLNDPEWENSLSFSVETNHNQSEKCSEKSKREVSRSNMVTKKSIISKNVTKQSKKEKNGETLHMPLPMMTRSRHRSSCNTSVQVKEVKDPEHILQVRPSSDACTLEDENCWRCLLVKVMESGRMKDFIYMKWEFHRRRLQLRLLNDIGNCTRSLGEIHKTHEIFWQSISLLYCRKTLDETTSAALHSVLLEFIGKGGPGDVFAAERAAILFNISWFSVKNYRTMCPRASCCGFSSIQIPKIVSWLLQAFILSREIPLLFQKVSRLLAVIFLLSTSGGPFSIPLSSSKSLSASHWAAYFHQASLGTYFNRQFLSNSSAHLKMCHVKDLQSSHATCSTDETTEACHFLRFAPESVDDLENFVIEFFHGLPCITTICISLLGCEFADLLGSILPSHSSFPSWILLTRLTSSAQPIVMVLPVDLILEALDDDATDDRGSISEHKDPSKTWQCPWGYTVVDDVAPQFKMILEESYLSSSILPSVDTQENRLLWWTWRRKLNDRLDKFLRSLEESWLGPWKCLLLGEPSNYECLNAIVPKLLADLKSTCQFDGNENLFRLILGGVESISEAKSCASQLLLQNSYVGRGGCWGRKFGLLDDVDEGLSLSAQKFISEAFSKLGNDYVEREPVVLVLDSEVQMLPWENLPIMRKQEAYRMPSVGSISAVLNTSCNPEEQIGRIAVAFPSIDPLDAFYLLNPSGDLGRTQVEFEDWFRDQKLEGKAGTVPASEELVVALKNHDLFIYFGHGSGSQYISGDEIQKLTKCAATLLMGCSSGSLSLKGCYNPQGVVLSYLLAGSPAIIANLWEVTDKDIDRFGKAILNAWLEERSRSSSVDNSTCNLVEKEFEALKISNGKRNEKKKVSREKKAEAREVHRPTIGSFMSQAREACTLPFLIGAAPVCYGVPTRIRKNDRRRSNLAPFIDLDP